MRLALLALGFLLMARTPVEAQTPPPIIIPVTKERVRYFNVSEDGSRISCGIVLYGSFPVYKGRTNITDYNTSNARLGVQNPGSWHLDSDNRFRFTAWFNGGDGPFSDNPNCNHTIGEGLPEWYAEYHPKPPRASFTATAIASEPGAWEFLSTSTDAENQPLIEQWVFGDETSGSGPKEIHRYTKPGNFTAALTVTDTDGLTNRTTRIVTVPAPKPVVSVQLFNKHSGNRIEIEEEFDVRVAVRATDDGVGALSNLVFTAPPLAVPGLFTLLSTPAHTNIGSLQPGERREFDWRLRADRAGEFALAAGGVRGRDAIGRTVTGAGAAAEGQVTALIVGIEQRPPRLQLGADNNNDGKTNALDMRLELIVGITNVSKQNITEVKSFIVDDPIQLTSLAQDLNIWITPTNVPPGDFGTIAPGAANAVLRTNVYIATDRTYAEASILLQGKVDDTGVQARGEGIVNVGGETLLEARFDIEDRPYKAGQVVRVFGSLKNVSRFKNNRGEVIDEGKTIGVVVYPSTDGNGTGGYLVEKGFGGRTPDSPTAFMLAPDEEKEIAAIVPTAEVADANTVTLNYAVHAYTHGEDAKPRRADPASIEIVEQDGWSSRHTVSLTGVPDIHDPWLVCPTDLSFAGFVSCRFTEGLGNLGGGLVDVGMLTASGLREIAVARWRFFGWKAWATREAIKALLGDEAARARLETELLLDLQALQDVGVESLQGIKLAAGSIGPAIERNFIFTMRTLESGDLKTIAGGMARITGENIDVPLEALVAARSARKAMLMSEAAESAAKAALMETIQKKADNLASSVEDFAARQSIQDLPSSDVLPNGIDVLKHPRIWRDAYGALRREVDAFLKIAQEEGLLLAFRSRSPAAAALIDAGKALLKPHGVSIKTVSELDVRFLGYPKKYEGLCALVSPPVPWSPRGFDRDLAVEKYLDRIPELSGSSPASADLRAQVRERLHFQMDEWPKQVKNFRKYNNEGINVNFYGEKNDLGFDDIPNENLNRAARLSREELPPAFDGEPPRFGYLLEMEDAYKSGRFLPIGGDIDFLGMFKPDGSLPDLVTRIRVYQKLRAAGMQHGESFTFYLKDLRDKFLRCCSPPPFGENEKMLTATPNGQLITTQFKDELSVIEGGPNSALKVGDGEFAYLDGAISEISSATRPGTPVIPAPADITYEGVEIRSVATLARVVSDLDAVLDRREGKLVRIGPDGKPEVYESPSGETPTAGLHGPGADVGARTSGTAGPRLQQAGQNPSVDAALEADLASLAAAGYVNAREITPRGGQGGQWRPVSSAEIRPGEAGASFKIAPYTYLTRDVPGGSTILPVFSSRQMEVTNASPLFAVGDLIVVDPGGVDEEFATVVSVHPLTLNRPLTSPKQIGAMVLFLEGVADGGALPGALPAQENLLVWLRADAGLGLTNGTNVISWTDQSRNNFVFTAPTVATRPVWVANSTFGVPAVRFAAASTPRLQGNLGRTLTNATIFSLVRWVDTSNGDRFVYAFGTPNFSGLMMTLARRDSDQAYHWDGAARRTVDNTIPGTSLRMFTQVFGEDRPDRHHLSVNLQTVLDTRTTTGRAYSAVATNVVLGSYVNGTSGLVGDLVEWLVYDRVLSVEERFEVEEYLRQRAGLAPSVTAGSVDLSSSDIFDFDVSTGPEVSWSLDAANRQLVQTGAGDPSFALSGFSEPGQVIRTKLRASAGSGALGAVFGFQHRGAFHLFDWRQTAGNDAEWGVAPAGMRLRSFHLPEGQEPTGADLWSGLDTSRVTTWRTNTIPWVAGREYEVVIRLGANATVVEVNFGAANLETWTVPELKGISGQFGHYAYFLPETRFGPVTLPEAMPVITEIELGDDGNYTVRWRNGLPPFVVESTTDLSSGAWYPAGPATPNYFRTIEASEQALLFRVRSAGVVPDGGNGAQAPTFGNDGKPWFIRPTGPTRIEAENFDEGGPEAAYHDTEAANQGNTSYRSEAVDIGSTADAGGGFAIGWFGPGEWLEYTIEVATAGTYHFRFRAARGEAGNGTARVYVDGVEKIGNVTVPSTGRWRDYTTVTLSGVSLEAGVHTLRIEMVQNAFDLNWIEIISEERQTFGNDGNPWLITGATATRIQAENFDEGGPEVAYHDTTSANQIGATYRSEAVDIGATTDVGGGFAIGWMMPGEWLEYLIDVATAGTYQIRFRAARGDSGNGNLRVSVDGVDKTGIVAIPGTGGWQNFITVTKRGVSLEAGVHKLRIEVVGSGFDLNWIEILSGERQTFGNDGKPWLIAGTGPTRIEAENFDEGGEGVAYQDNDPANQGGTYRSEAVDIQPTTDTGGGFNLGWIGTGEWLEYTINLAAAGTYQLRFRTAREPAGSRTLRVLVGGVDKTGNVTIPSTSGWQTWTTVTKTGVSLEAGIQKLRIEMVGGDFNLNWIEIAP